MDRAEAEAIYDSGRERCVEVLLELAGLVERLTVSSERLEERVRRLEERARQDSRTSSKPPSQDPPKTRQQRRAEAREKAKELLSREGSKRNAGGQVGHAGAGRELVPEDQVDAIWSITRGRAVAVDAGSQRRSMPVAGSAATRSASCRRSA